MTQSHSAARVDSPEAVEHWNARFSGITRLYGTRAAERIRRAHVCVVGIGGVGTWVAEALARTGVGRITLVDMDEICVTNTNRQLHALNDTVGKSKVATMAARLREIHPMIEVRAINDFFDDETADDVLGVAYDFVIDAIDDTRNKCRLIAACRDRGLPIIVSGGAGGRRDATKIQVADLNRSGGDGLLRDVRRTLRKEFGFEAGVEWNIPCVFSTEKVVFPTPEGEICETAPAGGALRLDCSEGFGAASFVTGPFGLIAAQIAVNSIAGL